MVGQLIFSSVILAKSYTQWVESNYNANEQIFRQVVNNVEKSHETIQSLCDSLFMNPEIVRLMYNDLDSVDIYDQIIAFQKIYTPVLNSNPLVHSIYIYNEDKDAFLSSYRYLEFQDEELRTMMNERTIFSRKYNPIVRWIDEPSKKKTKVMTYVLYNSINGEGRPEGAVVVNVDFNKFIDEVRQLFTFVEEEKSRILIFDQKENMIFTSNKEEEDALEKDRIKKVLTQFQGSSKQVFDLKKEKISGEKYGVFFTKVDELDWTIVKVQSYDDIFGDIHNKLLTTVVISSLFCVVMLALTYVVAQKIYSPIGRLVEKTKREQGEKDTELNEIEYLSQMYENLSGSLKEYQKKGEKNKNVLNYNLHRLLLDEEGADERILESLCTEDKEFFGIDNWYGVGVIQIDNYRKLRADYNHKEQDLYKFSIENILAEILAGYGYRSVRISVADDMIAVIVHGDFSNDIEYREIMETCFRNTNGKMKEYFQISFSTSISSYQKGIRKICELYHNAERQLLYRYVLGKEALIFYDYDVKRSGYEEPEIIIEQLKDHIQNKNEIGIRTDFEKMTETLCQHDNETLMEFLVDFVVQIFRVIEVSEKTNSAYGGKKFLEQYAEILSMETWAEMSEQLQKILWDIIGQEDKEKKKTKLLVELVQKMVKEEFSDPNLCLQQIAEMVKMSSQYVGRMFKGEMGLSVAEYINEYRLEKSVEIMLNTGCTVKEVLYQVGIEHESQYYRLFKKKYGVSPKAYILEQLTENTIE